MKKSVSIVILVIFIASIFIVGFFGMRVKSYNVKYYAEEILITNKEYNSENNTIVLKVDRDYKTLPFEFQIDVHVIPNNATNKKIEFSATDPNSPFYSIDDNGLLTVNNLITFKIFLRTIDGSNLVKEVRIKVL